jgi:hypothetical protein
VPMLFHGFREMSPYAHQIYIIKPMPATYILSISMASEEAHMLGQGPFRIPLAAVRAAYTTPSSAPGTTAAVSNIELQKQNTEMKTKIKEWRNQIATIKPLPAEPIVTKEAAVNPFLYSIL